MRSRARGLATAAVAGALAVVVPAAPVQAETPPELRVWGGPESVPVDATPDTAGRATP